MILHLRAGIFRLASVTRRLGHLDPMLDPEEVKQAFTEMADLLSANLSAAAQGYALCEPLKSSRHSDDLLFLAEQTFANLNMANYPPQSDTGGERGPLGVGLARPAARLPALRGRPERPRAAGGRARAPLDGDHKAAGGRPGASGLPAARARLLRPCEWWLGRALPRFRRVGAPARGASGHGTLRGLVGLRQRPRWADATRHFDLFYMVLSCFWLCGRVERKVLGHLGVAESCVGPSFEPRWDFQTCSFEVEKIGFGGRQMFPSFPWSSSWLENHCQRRFQAVGRRQRVWEWQFSSPVGPASGPLWASNLMGLESKMGSQARCGRNL